MIRQIIISIVKQSAHCLINIFSRYRDRKTLASKAFTSREAVEGNLQRTNRLFTCRISSVPTPLTTFPFGHSNLRIENSACRSVYVRQQKAVLEGGLSKLNQSMCKETIRRHEMCQNLQAPYATNDMASQVDAMNRRTGRLNKILDTLI